MHELHRRLHLEQRLAVDHLRERDVVSSPFDPADEHLPFGICVRIAETGAEEEPVELGLGQRIRAFVLDRVLRRQHEKGSLERPGNTVRRHLSLLHRLEQRRLRFRRGAVDLVGEQQMGEDGPGAELEVAVALIPDRRPGHVGGKEVGCELHAAEAEPDRLGKGTRRKRLRESRHILEQHVTVAEDAEQHELELFTLADHRALDLVDEAAAQLGQLPQLHQTCSRAETTRSR